MSNTLKILKAAREIIADPAHWTKGWYAHTAEGHTTNHNDPAACKFCSIGAIRKAAWDADLWDGYASDHAVQALSDAINKRFGFKLGVTVHEYNDSHTHSQVLKQFDKAIERLENEAKQS